MEEADDLTVGTIALRTPIMVDGAERSEFPYDLNKVTTAQFMAAEARSKRTAMRVATAETDYSFHLQLGFQAAIAADPTLAVEDLERVSGRDVKKFMDLGRFFTNVSDEQDPGTSDGPQEATPSGTRRPSPTSTDGPSGDSSPSTGRQ